MHIVFTILTVALAAIALKRPKTPAPLIVLVTTANALAATYTWQVLFSGRF